MLASLLLLLAQHLYHFLYICLQPLQYCLHLCCPVGAGQELNRHWLVLLEPRLGATCCFEHNFAAREQIGRQHAHCHWHRQRRHACLTTSTAAAAAAAGGKARGSGDSVSVGGNCSGIWADVYMPGW
jgi:hypothetical protein